MIKNCLLVYTCLTSALLLQNCSSPGKQTKLNVQNGPIENSEKAGNDSSQNQVKDVNDLAPFNPEIGTQKYMPTSEAHAINPHVSDLLQEGVHSSANVVKDGADFKMEDEAATSELSPNYIPQLESHIDGTDQRMDVGGMLLEKKDKKYHISRIDFRANKTQFDTKAPQLAGHEPWEDIPNFVVITGQNGSGKSKLMEYIYEQLSLKEFAEKHLALYKKDVSNWQKTSAKTHTFKSDPKKTESFITNTYGENFIDLIEKYKVHKSLPTDTHPMFADLLKVIKGIEGGSISWPPKDPQARSNWLRKVSQFLYAANKNFASEADYINDPFRLLNDVCENYYMLSNSMYKKNNNFRKDQDDEKQKELEIQQVTGHRPPWIEINEILEKYGFKYKIWKDIKGQKNYRFKIGFEKENAILPELLSSGEKVILELLTQLYYFQNVSAEGKNPTKVKHVEIMLLDEPDKHLDPVLCKSMYEILYNEFVQKHGIQIFMITHRPDAVFFAPNNSVYTIGEHNRLRPDKVSAFKRMTKNIISQAVNQKSANSFLSEGALNVLEDINYVLTENEEDVKFYNIIYQKLQRRFPEAITGKTQLIFMPVGIKLDTMRKGLQALSLTCNNIKEEVSSLNKRIQDINTSPLNKLLKSLDQQLNVLVGHIDCGGGSDAIKKKVNKIPLYQGHYDEYGRVDGEKYLTELKDKNHNQNVFWGIIDNDNASRGKNATSAIGKVHALDAYSFENYLCMPLNLFYYLRKYCPEAYQMFNYEANEGITKNRLAQIFKCEDEAFEQGASSEEQLQQISDWVDKYLQGQLETQQKQMSEQIIEHVKGYEKLLPNIVSLTGDCLSSVYKKCQIFNEKNTDSLELMNGIKITCRKAFFTKRGHDLVGIMGQLMLWQSNEKTMESVLHSLQELLKSNEKNEKIFKGKLSEIVNTMVTPAGKEKQMKDRLFNSLERIPVNYLPKTLLNLIQRVQNSEPYLEQFEVNTQERSMSLRDGNLAELFNELRLAWKNSPLEAYKVVYCDAIYLTVKRENSYSKEALVARLNVSRSLRKEAVDKIDLIVADGLQGGEDRIYPGSLFQNCHDSTVKEATTKLEAFGNQWKAIYPEVVKTLINDRIPYYFTYLSFPHPLRKMIYATHSIESLNKKVRKATKNKQSLKKVDRLWDYIFVIILDEISPSCFQKLERGKGSREYKLSIGKDTIYITSLTVSNFFNFSAWLAIQPQASI
eukprot:gene315-404_t